MEENTLYLSYLMGAENIEDDDLAGVGVQIVERKPDGDRTLKVPENRLPQYLELIKAKLNKGFWNEVIGAKEIVFVFKFKNGFTKEWRLSEKNEAEIGKTCTEFNNDPLSKTANVYKYLSSNNFYRDFMMEHYADLINR